MSCPVYRGSTVTVIEACGRMFSPCCGSTTSDRPGELLRRGAAHFVPSSEDRHVHHDEHDHGDDRDAFGMLRSAQRHAGTVPPEFCGSRTQAYAMTRMRATMAATVVRMPGSVGSDLPGRVLAGRYLLHGAIGTGASGRVYVADDQRLRRRVAVKVLHAALADDAAFLRRFRAEAQLAASLHHPNIVTVYDWGEDDVPFMVLELLEGGSLRSMLDQNTLLTVAQAARVGRDVASALEYAHARDVLHRDVKPANLLFDEHGIVRVADFGLARALAEASWTEPAGGMLGTARYASPEQAMGLQLDARSDLYSLALVLVEAVTGRVPFASDTTIGMLTARTQKALRAPDELGPLGAVIDRVGGLDPDDRYPDAGTMRQALADVGDDAPAARCA